MYVLTENMDVSGLPAAEQYAFALGVEWSEFHRKLCGGASFRTVCRLKNRDRFVALAAKCGRFCEDHPLQPGWCEVFVGDVGRGPR